MAYLIELVMWKANGINKWTVGEYAGNLLRALLYITLVIQMYNEASQQALPLPDKWKESILVPINYTSLIPLLLLEASMAIRSLLNIVISCSWNKSK